MLCRNCRKFKYTNSFATESVNVHIRILLQWPINLFKKLYLFQVASVMDICNWLTSWVLRTRSSFTKKWKGVKQKTFFSKFDIKHKKYVKWVKLFLQKAFGSRRFGGLDIFSILVIWLSSSLASIFWCYFLRCCYLIQNLAISCLFSLFAIHLISSERIHFNSLWCEVAFFNFLPNWI